MTDEMTKADPAVWEAALAKYRTAVKEQEAAPRSLDSLEFRRTMRRVWKMEQLVLDTAAPDVGAVVEKLMILWHDELNGEDQTSLRKCKIIGDLNRIQWTAVAPA